MSGQDRISPHNVNIRVTLLCTTQVNGVFRRRWLASWEVNSAYHSPPNSRWDKIARRDPNYWPFFGILKKKNFFFLVSLCIQLSFDESGRCLPLLRWIMKGGGGAYTFNLSHAYSPRSPPPRKKLVTPDVYPIALKIWDLIFQTGIHLFPLLRYCESILKWKIFLTLCLTGCITLRVGFASWQELPHDSYLQACAL